MRPSLVLLLAVATTSGCDESPDEYAARLKLETLTGPCHDESWLLATTGGSPSNASCSNRYHRMRVQVATHPSNEEAAALVFCECVYPAEIDGGKEEPDAP